jgi:hypothetical protein
MNFRKQRSLSSGCAGRLFLLLSKVIGKRVLRHLLYHESKRDGRGLFIMTGGLGWLHKSKIIGGWAIVIVPITSEKTFEDDTEQQAAILLPKSIGSN